MSEWVSEYRAPAKELNSPPFPRGPLYCCPCRNLTSSGLSPQPWHSDSGKEIISVSFLISIRVSLHVLLTLFAFIGSLSAIGLFIHSRHTTFILWWQLCLFAPTILSRSQSICLPFNFVSLPQQTSLNLHESVCLSACFFASTNLSRSVNVSAFQLCLFASTNLPRSPWIFLPFSFVSLPKQPSLTLSQSVCLSALSLSLDYPP